MMTSDSRVLTFDERIKLYAKMKSMRLTQTAIAKKNRVSIPMINKFCLGEYNATPKIKKFFFRVGINLDDIMGENNGTCD